MKAPTWILGLLTLALLPVACEQEDGPGAAETSRDPAPALTGNFPAVPGTCDDLPGAETLRRYVRTAPDSGVVGGIFDGEHEWAAVVNRAGALCAVVAAADSAGALWPGSRAVAMAKAYTANGFSTQKRPTSTARLYTMAQPGRSLYGSFVGNPFDPACLDMDVEQGTVCGGTIPFGGGLPLYDAEGHLVGGLGLSGDTPCADHEVAKRVRAMAGLVPPGGNFVDDITYAVVDGPSLYTHPLCANTWRNEQKIGDAPPAPAYPHDLPEGRVPGTPPGGADTLPSDPPPGPADTTRSAPR